MKVKTERIVSEKVEDLEVRRDAQRKNDKAQIFENIRKVEAEQNEHDRSISILLERSSAQADATKRIDGHIKELGGKLDDLRDLIVNKLAT